MLYPLQLHLLEVQSTMETRKVASHIFFRKIIELMRLMHHLICIFLENLETIFLEFFGIFLARSSGVKRHERQKPEVA